MSIISKDQGYKNAVATTLLNIPSEVRKNKDDFNKVFNFIKDDIPLRMKSFSGKLKNFTRNKDISQIDFKVESFRKLLPSPDIFNTPKDLFNFVDFDFITEYLKLNDIELIGLDESKVDVPLQGSVFCYLKSVAFRMFISNNEKREIIGPLIDEMRSKYSNDEQFEKENQFWGYIRNIFVIYLTIKNSIANGYKPLAFMHGPLVRAIGGFTDIHLTYEQAYKLVHIENADGIHSDLSEDIDGSILIEELHEKEKTEWNSIELTFGSDDRQRLDRLLALKWLKSSDTSSYSGSTPYKYDNNGAKIETLDYKDRCYSGLSLYLFLIRKLFDLCKDNEAVLVSVVENISRSTEHSRYVIPNLFFKSDGTFVDWLNSDIKRILNDDFNLNYPNSSSPDFNKLIFKYALNMIDVLNISDSTVYTYLLKEAEYLSPIQIYRYVSRKFFTDNLNNDNFGIDNAYSGLLNSFLDSSNCKILMSYLRTTPYREPIRVEFFDVYNDYKKVLGLTYFLSLFYQSFGIPIILYYVDKVARTPKDIVERLVKAEVQKILYEGGFEIVDTLRVTNDLSRNFLKR